MTASCISLNSVRVSAASIWNERNSCPVIPRPMPHWKRPPESTSSIAPSSATRSGLWNGSTLIAQPSLMRVVVAAIAAIIRFGDGSVENVASKWCSASHTASKPSSSASRASRRIAAETSPSVPWPRVGPM